MGEALVKSSWLLSNKELERELVNISCEILVLVGMFIGSDVRFGTETSSIFGTKSLVSSSLVFGLGMEECEGLLLTKGSMAFVGGELVMPG